MGDLIEEGGEVQLATLFALIFSTLHRKTQS